MNEKKYTVRKLDEKDYDLIREIIREYNSYGIKPTIAQITESLAKRKP